MWSDVVSAGRAAFRPSDQDVVENHNFISGSGSSYVIGKAVITTDEGWDF
jgi:ribonucleoside-diphosphate reductase beta chain